MPRTKQFDREKVLQKAMELFWKKGFHATSIQDLVTHLGINRGSMYDTFGGKDQLFRESLQYYRQLNSMKLRSIEKMLESQSAQSFLDNFFAIELQNLKKDKDSKGCFVVNTTTELANQSPDILQLLKGNMKGAVKMFSRIVEIAQEKGEVSSDRSAEAIGRHLFTFFNGLKVVAKIETNQKKLAELIKEELNWVFG